MGNEIIAIKPSFEIFSLNWSLLRQLVLCDKRRTKEVRPIFDI